MALPTNPNADKSALPENAQAIQGGDYGMTITGTDLRRGYFEAEAPDPALGLDGDQFYLGFTTR